MDDSLEKKLLLNLKKGDAGAFEIIFFKYNQRLFNFCFRFFSSKEEAGDLVQRVFISLWEQRDMLDPERPVSSYLYGIARNLVYQEFRKSVFKEALNRKIIKEAEISEDSGYREIFFDDLKEVLAALIEQLPGRQKEIYKLSREEGLSYTEIASRLGISENTVDTQLRRALSFLREKYSNLYR